MSRQYDDQELDQLLASMNPVVSTDAIPAATLGPAAIIEKAEARRRRRRLRLALPILPVVAVAATAAAIALQPAPAEDAFVLSVECSADLTNDRVSSAPATNTNPAEDCARLWAQGGVRPGSTDVPPLSACVTGGVARVYPGVDSCRLLALTPFSNYKPAQAAAIELNGALLSYVVSDPQCRPASDIVEFAQDQLNARSLDDWKVVVQADPSCLGIFVDVAAKTVRVD